MAVIFAIGGAAVGVVAIAGYSDHSDYSDYGDYDDYSNAAEQHKKLVKAKKEEIKSAGHALADYKLSTVNPHLENEGLKQSPAMVVSANEMDRDAKGAIGRKVQREMQEETRGQYSQVKEIDRLLARIQEIREEEGYGDD